MENAEEIMHALEEFSKRKFKTIPQELNDYLLYVARTGDPVYQWTLVKSLFKEKLLNVISDFVETTPGLDIPPYPNVDPFNYDAMKNTLIERLDSFAAAPFTVQRISELLTFPRKQYNRIDKFMRAVEKNILVVSTREPGPQRHAELENGDPLEPMVNGSDSNSEYNVDVEMEDMSWKESAEQKQRTDPQPSSSDTHINIEDDAESRLQAKQDSPMEMAAQEKPIPVFESITAPEKPAAALYESVTPPKPDTPEDQKPEPKPIIDTLSDSSPPSDISPPTETTPPIDTSPSVEASLPTKTSTEVKLEKTTSGESPNISPATLEEPKMDTETNIEPVTAASLIIPAITVDDAEMTEQKLIKRASMETEEDKEENIVEASTSEAVVVEQKKLPNAEPSQAIDDSSSDSNKEEANEPKLISEVSTSSEESSSSSDVTDGNSNSPRQVHETNLTIQDDSNSNQSEGISEEPPKIELVESKVEQTEEIPESHKEKQELPQVIQSDNYSISDVKSELPQPESENVTCKSPEKQIDETKNEIETDIKLEATKTEPEVPTQEES